MLTRESPPEARTAEPAATYLAKLLVAERGYTEAISSDLQDLAGDKQDKNIVLMKEGPLSLSVICIVDAETDSSRRFEMSSEDLQLLAAILRDQRTSWRWFGSSVVIDIVEVRDAVSERDRSRARQLVWGGWLGFLAQRASARALVLLAMLLDIVFRDSDRGSKGDIIISTYFANPKTAEVVGDSVAVYSGETQRYLQEALKRRRTPRGTKSASAGRMSFPFATAFLILAAAAGYALELAFPVSPCADGLRPSVETLVATGGMSSGAVLGGEWYRLFTSTFLHGGLRHFLNNMASLAVIGLLLEALWGRAWLFVAFLVGGLGGSLLSLKFKAPSVVSVGASGAILAMAVGSIFAMFRVPASPGRSRRWLWLLACLALSLNPMAAPSGEHIDYMAHLGGAIAGAIVGLVTLLAWPRSSARPRLSGAAWVVAAAGIAVVGWSALLAARTYHEYDYTLMADGEQPQTTEDAMSRAADLVARYPRDPRTLKYLALKKLNEGSPAAAEVPLHAALREKYLLEKHFSSDLTVSLRVLLAKSLLRQGRQEDALLAALPACRMGPGDSVPSELLPLNLCDAQTPEAAKQGLAP